jgi:anti-sigma B factor antagonist
MRRPGKTIRRRDRPVVRPRTARGFGGSVDDMLSWAIENRGDLVIVVAGGELDIHSAPVLAQQLTPAADAGRHLILDLAGLRFCDCAGLGLFLRTRQRAVAAGGSLHLAAPTASTRRLITMARVGDILPVAASVADAIARLDLAGAPRPRPREPGEDDPA